MTPPGGRPDPPATLAYDPLEVMRIDGEGLLAAANLSGALDAPVPTCPGWRTADLVFHVASVWRFWGRICELNIDSPSQLDAIPFAEQPPDTALTEWATHELVTSMHVLADAPADTEVWTWTGANQPIAWVRRRMAQETAVHRWDAEHAAGTAWDIGPEISADGIDEFLMWHGGRAGPNDAAVSGRIELASTDTDHRFLVTRFGDDMVQFDRSGGTADVVVSGTASSLLLWLWRRTDTVEVAGDTALAARFRTFNDLN